jgi:NADH-ubiquinone oxidoreductase chain 2
MIFISILIMIMVIAIPSINKNISSSLFSKITFIILIYAGALSLNAFYIQSIGSGIGIYNGYFTVTPISQFFDFFIFLTGAFILLSFPYFKTNSGATSFNKEKNSGAERGVATDQINIFNHFEEYSLIILFSLMGSTFLISCSDLISIYLSIELQSFGVYILASLFKDSLLATGAGLKYFLLGGLSSCLILIGIGLIYTYTGLTNLDSLYSLILSSPILPSSMLNTINSNLDFSANSLGLIGFEGFSLGLIFIVVGLLFKISAAPLHNWSVGLLSI